LPLLQGESQKLPSILTFDLLFTLSSSFLNISISRPWLIEEEEILWKSREEEERARAGILRSTISNDFWGSNEDLLEQFFRIFGLGVEFFGLN
jgi:hypothetical protein